MLVRPNHRPIHELDAPVHLPSLVPMLLDGREDPIPDPGLAPPPEPAVHRRPRAIPLRQIAPGRARPLSPDDGVDDPPMLHVRSAPLRSLGRQQRLQPFPLLVGQLSSMAHADCGAISGPPIWSFCVHTLAVAIEESGAPLSTPARHQMVLQVHQRQARHPPPCPQIVGETVR